MCLLFSGVVSWRSGGFFGVVACFLAWLRFSFVWRVFSSFVVWGGLCVFGSPKGALYGVPLRGEWFLFSWKVGMKVGKRNVKEKVGKKTSLLESKRSVCLNTFMVPGAVTGAADAAEACGSGAGRQMSGPGPAVALQDAT